MRQPGAPLWRIVWWHLVHAVCYIWLGACYRYRAWGVNHIPQAGPVLFLSNHQSYLDPVAVALASHRRQFRAMARSTLFGNAVFGWLIKSINAIPINRGAADLAAMRRTIQILKEGHALLVFPEGTRTTDGVTGPFASGTMLLVKRAKPQVVPVAIEGAYHAWPKGQAIPRLTGRIGVAFGQPISPDDLIAMGDQRGLAYVHQKVEQMRLELARRHSR